jgi:hypothetical protein
MGSKGSRQIQRLFIAALLVGGCVQPAAATVPAPQAAATDGAPTGRPAPTDVAMASPDPSASPEPEPTAKPTVEPERTPKPCPTADVLSVREFDDAPRRCFGPEDIQIRGWLDSIDGLHGTGPSIRPWWLAYPQSGRTCDEQKPECFYAFTLWVHVPPDLSPCSREEPHCSIVFPHVPPSSGLDLLPLQRWVILTGHTNDAAAERCHWWYGDEPEMDLDNAEAVRHCRKEFVVTAIEAAP